MVVELFKYMVLDYNNSLKDYVSLALTDINDIDDILLCMAKLNTYDFDKIISTIEQLKVKKEVFKTYYNYAKSTFDDHQANSEVDDKNKFLEYQKSLLLQEEVSNSLSSTQQIPALGDVMKWGLQEESFDDHQAESESEVDDQTKFLEYQKSLLLQEEMPACLLPSDRLIPALGDVTKWGFQEESFNGSMRIKIPLSGNAFLLATPKTHLYITKKGYRAPSIEARNKHLFDLPLEELADAKRLTGDEHPMVGPCELLNFGLYHSDEHGYFALRLEENDEEQKTSE